MSVTFTASPKASEKTAFLFIDDGSERYSFSTWLYADTGFDSWSASASTDQEKEFRDAYSAYTLEVVCDITQIALNDGLTPTAGLGCCLRDRTQTGGGYCVRVASSEDGVVTSFLTEA